MRAAQFPSTAPRSPLIAGLLSLFVPGLGQAWQGQFRRGLSIFLATATAAATAYLYGKPVWYLVPAALWAWNVWDAVRLPKGAPVWMAALLWLGISYGIGLQVTEFNPSVLLEHTDRAASIIRPMLRPDFVTTRSEELRATVQVQVPCSPEPPKAENTVAGVHIRVTPDCGSLNETLLLSATGLWPNYPTNVMWATPIGDVKLLGEGFNRQLTVNTDATGYLSTALQVPPSALQAAPDPTLPLPHKVILVQSRPIPGYSISENGRYVVQGIYETLALALLATAVGAVIALPLGFLAARNLMSGNPLTAAVYVVLRTIMNIVRSIEALIMGIIFVVIVGLGPFAGMLALTLHTVAALGKLYSEVIEGIDPGPIEAVRATGANWLQVVRYAIIPQIVPPFTALTIYRWDINVRSSTIIGFVGGGGIGFFLVQWINIGDYRAVSTTFIAIALVVILMDFFSARLRERLM